ncbi:MAG TPA: hydrogenase expression/formation protein HypE [Pelotomaculum sp.]|nr:hydrogenase expression/formation protein HypE [Pelotomaculum sp.]
MSLDRIMIGHGGGGRLSQQLISNLFLKYLGNPILNALEDAATVMLPQRKIAFTTDSYVVTPRFFPGGNIGKLAVCGTVNDLAMRGALPLYLSVGFIIEEGLPIAELEDIVRTMAEAASTAEVQIATGDTKVVGRGAADGIYINTAGIGIVDEKLNISAKNAQPGDKVIISGTIGDHGMTILSLREGLSFKADLRSDCAPLNGLVKELLCFGNDIHVLRDPTRGGIASSLNEIAVSSNTGMIIDESCLPFKPQVKASCELLGLDPLHLANEGKFIVIVAASAADNVLEVLHGHEYGKDAVIIGEVTDKARKVALRTYIGSTRIIDIASGELLPRIC